MERNAVIFIAGHQGMVGSAIVRRLRRAGYSNLVTRTRAELDLRIQADVEQFFAEQRIEYVFMAAALVGGIQANAAYPVDFLMDNLCLQNHIFQSAHRHGVRKILFLGSSCIFPGECAQPMTEECLLAGKPEPTNEPYAIAKIAGVRACAYYNRQYGASYTAVTPANCYGVGDCLDPKKSHVIPALIRKFYDAKRRGEARVTLWGTGTPLREFLYVDDLADACLFLMNREERIDLINVGSGQEISILQLSHLIKRIVGFEGEIVCDADKPDGMMRRVVDCSRLRELGWTPSVTMEEGLQKTYAWFLETVEGSGKGVGKDEFTD